MDTVMGTIFGWSIVGVVVASIVQMVGTNVLFLKQFQSDVGQKSYANVVIGLSIFALLMASFAGLSTGYMIVPIIFILFGLGQSISVNYQWHLSGYGGLLCSSCSSIIALLGYVMLQHLVAIS